MVKVVPSVNCTFKRKSLQNGASITGTISGLGDVDIEVISQFALNVQGDTTLSGDTIINGDLTVNGTITLKVRTGSLYRHWGVHRT